MINDVVSIAMTIIAAHEGRKNLFFLYCDFCVLEKIIQVSPYGRGK